MYRRRPARHVDVGSRITFVVGLTAFTPVTFVDLRPLEVELPGLEAVAGSVLRLPFPDRSIESLSCLHVAEHIGLGRYSDPLDPDGTRKAARELERALAPGGPVLLAARGEPRTEFNGHRAHDPDEGVGFFPELQLEAAWRMEAAGMSASVPMTWRGRAGPAVSTCSSATEQPQPPQAVPCRR